MDGEGQVNMKAVSDKILLSQILPNMLHDSHRKYE